MVRSISRLESNKSHPTNGSSPEPRKKAGPAALIPAKTNPGLEEAIAMSGGNQTALAKKIGGSPANITIARRRGRVSSDMAIQLFLVLRIKLSKLLEREVRCPHCHKDI